MSPQPPRPSTDVPPGSAPSAGPLFAPDGVPWAQPTSVAPPAVPARSSRRRSDFLPAAVAAVLGLAAGAVVAALIVTSVFLGAAEDIGRRMADGLGTEIGEAVAEGYLRSMEESMAAFEDEEGWYGDDLSEVEQFPPTEPAGLGPDATLDAYAQSCFAGDLQACDDLMFESPPMSDYEEYASTCGGRVKQYMLAACTELE